MRENKQGIFSNNDIYLISAFFGFVLGLLIFTFFSPNYYKKAGPVNVDIPKGATLSDVVDSLYNKEIISVKTNLRIAAFLYGAESKIKAGRYSIPNGLSYLGLIELLLEGAPEEQVLVTIGEGIWQENLASLLPQKLALDSARIAELSSDKNYLTRLGIEADDLEGYLLPETYYFFPHSSEEEVLGKLKREMDKIFEDPDIVRRMNELDMTKHEVLTLASIIEGESNIIGEFRKISGVYHNRLKRGMALQADPTIQYLIRHRRKNKIYYKDLEIDSPYNTYKYRGLPPGPINNPGKDAIHAAVYPEEHDLYYFVADGTGGHKFAKSYREHQRNVAAYRRWRSSQN